ncbi:hypothetical protein COB52_04935 [Candidatus Kaiserbacteria bacterium]|nr:MAG: hypothetical protein COB52_04935 [Candidatus Kaiserbacteria bacterium]
MELVILIVLIGFFGFDGYLTVATSPHRIRTRKFEAKKYGMAIAGTSIVIILIVGLLFPEVRVLTIIALASMFAGIYIADKLIPRHNLC